jgi:hypothetical protein
MSSDEDRIEAWLDGSLSGDDRATLGARLRADPAFAERAALARSIDASLRRSFGVPAAAGAGALSVLGRPSSARGLPRSVARALPWLVAAAAAVALVVAWRSLGSRAGGPASSAPSVVDSSPAAPELADLGCTLVPEPNDFARGLNGCEGRTLPLALCEEPWSIDLATVYREATASSTVFAACTDAAHLREEMTARFGEDLPLAPDAAERLHGPYTCSAWPTGAVYTADTGGVASVLVAESEDYVAQCLDLVVADAAGLFVFGWRVGELHLTEITPHAEPRLLQLFDAR